MLRSRLAVWPKVLHVGLRIQTPVRSVSSQPSYSSIDPLEVAKFSKAAGEWWNPRGDFERLHRMNPLRISYMRQHLLGQTQVQQGAPFKGLEMLDVGCGGGLLSESLARLGASVTAIDASKENIGIAKAHAAMDPALRKLSLSYECTTAGKQSYYFLT